MIKIYKCPGCGGEMVYDSGTDSLKCPKCGTSVPISEIEEKEAAGITTGFKGQEQADNAGNDLKEFKCPSCGASMVTDENTAATFCSFCGSPTLIESRLEGEFRPSRVIPFKFDKKQAQKNFKEWKGSGFLTPNKFKSDANMSRVSGVYVPYWLYSYTMRDAIEAEATRVQSVREGNNEIVTTNHFQVSHNTRAVYENVPYDASEKMPDENMAILEPYDYSELKDFSMPYLSGFAAEKFNYSAAELQDNVRPRLEEDFKDASANTIEGYDSVQVTDEKVSIVSQSVEYVMLPVWTLIFEYGGKKYPLYMNGQTGKIDGRLPESKAKKFGLFAGGFLLCFLIALLLF